jgi:plasmid stabilization system protein ParE
MFDKEKYKISSKNARIQLEKMFDYYEIDIDEIEEKELKRAIKGGYERLVKAIRLGRLEINLEDGIKIIQTTRNSGTKITYREIDGVAKSAMAGKEEKDYYGKSYALMGSLCDLGEAAIKKLKGVDLSLAEVLGMIFLSV